MASISTITVTDEANHADNAAKAGHNSADIWLNVQRRSDLREAMHSPDERDRIARARPLNVAA